MSNIVFTSLMQSEMTLDVFLLCVGACLVLGVVMALCYSFRTPCSRSFLFALATLPALVCLVIMMVDGNLGTGVAVAGAFTLVRFRSMPGTAREICAVFLSMAVGLACGIGYVGLAVVFALVMSGFSMVLTAVNFGGHRDDNLRKVLHITVPEDLDYAEIFTDILEKYTSAARMVSVKTTNLGSLNKLAYEITLKKEGTEKAMIDALRCRNGNLEISISAMSMDVRDL